MIFESVATDAAAGGILAHSMSVDAQRWAKGRRLAAADIAAASAAGIARLTIARLGVDDVGEDQAAGALAEVLTGTGVAALAPVHGRVNLAAAAAGLCLIDPAMVAAVNDVGEDLTLATLAPGSRVAAGDIIATIKIIPYAVAAADLAAARAAAAPIAVAAFRPMAVTLFQTQLPGISAKMLAKTAQVTRHRVEALGGEMTELPPLPHDAAALAAAIAAAAGDLILVAGRLAGQGACRPCRRCHRRRWPAGAGGRSGGAG